MRWAEKEEGKRRVWSDGVEISLIEVGKDVRMY